ncbi:FAD-dependent oxidoreductase [Nannocystis sp. SCPEA4]|uniref:FAD-dependent oxidoreductase n=1 Tax=Nannocystis sp. SCPEA4 TaxID=2996787 RepID=UPI00226E8D95|nr:FAD-dependent oxidoreductase [Nannocystis sp. SCPEA4]MCY1060587.1 FAD-dependent oxidoreductase [Nannocystis sp. SCPEA4]
MATDDEFPEGTRSLWQDTCDLPTFVPLTRDIEADVCIVGAGIVGLTAALLLTRAGRRVVVLDSHQPGGGNTGRTTAHLSNELDDRYCELARVRGLDAARQAWESHTAAIDCIEAIARDEDIDCDFFRRDGYLFLAPEHTEELLRRELQTVHEFGWRGVELLASAPQFDGPCLRFPDQAQFHPLKYLAGLCAAVVRGGGVIHGDTRVEDVEGGAVVVTKTSQGVHVRSGATIVATCSPICDLFAIHSKQASYTTYVVGLRVPPGSVPPALYWDTGDPYHYVRLQATPAGDVLIVGGEDHKTGQADDGERRFAVLESWARARVPAAQERLYRWSGQVFETLDGLAYIGADPGGATNVFVATGDSGMGMTHGTAAAMMLSAQIVGDKSPWGGLYDPRRRPLRSANEYVRENANVAAQYADWLRPGEVDSVADVAPGCGAILRSGLSRVAVYRDEDGEVHACSAACTHLLGSVSWNHLEKTWDCPCHGSRFDRLGDVIAGPARSGLRVLDPRTLR